MNPSLKAYVQTIWDYHHLHHELVKSDVIVVLGSHDMRVAERGAELFLEGWAPWIVFTGASGRLTEEWNQSEAKTFSTIAREMGVPEENILLEEKSTNTGENITFTRKLLQEKGILASRAILVQKPYMERRTYATAKKLWPELDICVTSPQVSLEDYPNEEIAEDRMIHIMVGDLQRIKEYPARGFQIEQEIPENVWKAYEALVRAGYTEHLLSDQS